MVTFTEVILNGKLHFLCSDEILWTTYFQNGFKIKAVNYESLYTKEKFYITLSRGSNRVSRI